MLYNKSHKFYFITIFDICLHLFLSNGFCSLQYSLIFVRMWFSRQPSCALRVAVSDWSITNLPFMYYWSSVSEGKSGLSIMLSSVRCEIALFSLKLVSLRECGHCSHQVGKLSKRRFRSCEWVMASHTWPTPRTTSRERHVFGTGIGRRPRRHPHLDQDQALQGEAPQEKVIPRLGAAPLRLHVGRQLLSARARPRRPPCHVSVAMYLCT